MSTKNSNNTIGNRTGDHKNVQFGNVGCNFVYNLCYKYVSLREIFAEIHKTSLQNGKYISRCTKSTSIW